MDIEKLKKLTRLANNNPNDNEANLAARKVCKMLEEHNWTLPAATQSTRGFDPRNRSYSDWVTEEMFRHQQAAARKAAERAAQERTRKEAEEKARKEQEEWRKREDEYREQQKRERQRRTYDPYDPANWDFNRETKYYTYTGAPPHEKDEWLRSASNRTWINTRTGQEITDAEYYAKYAEWTTTDYRGSKKKPEERDLKCNTCGAVYKTKFLGIPELFICFGCQRKK